MKIVAKITSLSNGQNFPQLLAFEESGEISECMTMTILDLIAELHSPADAVLEELLLAAKDGRYNPNNADLADFSVNDKLVWLHPPKAKEGDVCISNENFPDCSMEWGEPQCFKIDVFFLIQARWRDFLRQVADASEENRLEMKIEFEV